MAIAWGVPNFRISTVYIKGRYSTIFTSPPFSMAFVCFSCACLMRPPSLGTKSYQVHYLSVYSVLRAHIQFCRFDKADVTADVQWHFNHRPPLGQHFFEPRAHWLRISRCIGSKKLFGLVPPGGSRTLDFLRERRIPYPLGQALRFFNGYQNLAHNILLDSSTVICWTSPFVILGVSGLFCRFYSIFNIYGKSCQQTI